MTDDLTRNTEPNATVRWACMPNGPLTPLAYLDQPCEVDSVWLNGWTTNPPEDGARIRIDIDGAPTSRNTEHDRLMREVVEADERYRSACKQKCDANNQSLCMHGDVCDALDRLTDFEEGMK